METITNNMQEVKIEKFTRKKYEKYTNKGVPVRVFNKRGHEWTVKHFDYGANSEQVLMEREYYNKYRKEWVTDSWLYDEKGKTWNDQLYIVHGMNGIEKGDIIITKSSADADFFFYELFEGFCTCEKNVGFGTHWSCDCMGTQINLAHIFCACSGYLKHDRWIRKATDDEVKDFYQHLLNGGYGYDDEEGCLFDVPKVGVEYWSVETGNDGLAQVVHHEGAKSEEERTFGQRNVFTYEPKAEERAKMINCVMMHGKAEEK